MSSFFFVEIHKLLIIDTFFMSSMQLCLLTSIANEARSKALGVLLVCYGSCILKLEYCTCDMVGVELDCGSRNIARQWVKSLLRLGYNSLNNLIFSSDTYMSH